MTISEMLGQSGLLTLLGMLVVFSFIIVLILCMNLLKVIVHAFKLDKDKATDKKLDSSSGSNPPQVQAMPVSGDETQVIAAIAAALHDKQLRS